MPTYLSRKRILSCCVVFLGGLGALGLSLLLFQIDASNAGVIPDSSQLTENADGPHVNYVLRNETAIPATPLETTASELHVCLVGCVYSSTQAAVDVAHDGDVIKVATGTYTGVHARDGVTQVVYISKSITLQGGFTTTNWLTSDPEAYPTTLDAQGQGRVLYVTGPSAGSGQAISPTVEGLRIKGGAATGLGGGASGNDAGGGVYVITAAVTISRTWVLTNTAYDGGGLYLASSDVTLNDNTISGNSVEWAGGGLYSNSSSVVLDGNTISGNTADTGAGLRLHHSDVALNDNTITSNTASYGGGVYVESGNLTLNGGQIISNSATTDGGGVYIRGDGVTFTQTGVSTIAHNAANFGGGVYIVTGNTTLNGAHIISNVADTDGGGVFVWESNVKLNGGQISSNTAYHYGGGVYIAEDRAIFTQFGVATIAHNAATYGGGVYIRGGNATLSGGQITSNSAITDGGGVYVTRNSASFTQTGVSTIAHNSARFGGGVYVWDGRATLNGGQIISNSVSDWGGGVFIQFGRATLNGGQITGNSAHDGGGVYVRNITATLTQMSASTIAHNTASNWGGGVFVWQGNAMVSGGQIISNSANWGGGVHIDGSSATFIQTGVSTIAHNFANERGGGMSVSGGSVTLSGGQIVDNSASDGGGVYVGNSGASFIQTGDSAISHNTAIGGGGVFVQYGSAMLNGGQILDNSATWGGGVYLWSGNVTLSGGQITGNSAIQDGGGLYAKFGAASLSGGQIISNSATDRGGGVYADLITATVTLTNASTIARNTANYGGGLYVKDSPALIQGSVISANHAITSGGGIYLVGDSTAQVLDNQILSNTASSSAGGGVYISGDAAPVLRSNCILSNTAARSGGGVYVGGSGTLSPTLVGNTFAGNTSNSPDGGGGGIYVKGRPALIQDNDISGNRATVNDGGGIYLTGGTTARILGNRILDNAAGEDGGGVLVRDSDIYLANNFVQHNAADAGGGGLYLVFSNSTLNGNITSDNTAAEGGGLFLNYSDATLTNNVVADNRADTAAGAGLYIRGSSSHLMHTTIARNSDGSGVYVTNSQTSSSTVSMTNTILVSHTVGITVTAGNTATLEATLWGAGTWANGTDGGGEGTISTGTRNYWGDPAFLDPGAGDYHIRYDSAARDRGVDAGVTTDVDGESRPVGCGFDVGADEGRGWCVYLPLVMRNWPPVPDAPSLDPINNLDYDGTYTASWTTVVSTTFYMLEESSDNLSFSRIYSGTETSYVVSGRNPAPRYYYRVKACNGWRCSTPSDVKWVHAWWEHEDNDDYTQANGPLIPAMTYYGYPDDHLDHFEIEVQRAETIIIDLSDHTGQGVQLQLRDQNARLLDFKHQPPYHIERAVPAGRYYIRIFTESGHRDDVPYKLWATFSSQVALRTTHERYVTALDDEGERDWELVGEAAEIKDWEVFTLIWLGDNTIALKTFHDRYATAMGEDQNWVIKAKNQTLSDCSRFTLYGPLDGRVAFRTCYGKYVSARKEDDRWELRQMPLMLDWEMFALVSPPEDKLGELYSTP